jgi:hypothetical protein
VQRETVASSVLVLMVFVIAPVVMILVVAMIVRGIVTIPVLALVARDVLVVVPIIPHKVDWSAACVVLRTMIPPVLFVSGRDMQVDRLGRNILGRLHCDDGLRIDDQWGWQISNVDLAVETDLSDSDGYI